MKRFLICWLFLALSVCGLYAQVNFANVMFLHAEGAYYRLYPVTDAAYVAVKRDVRVMTGTWSISTTPANSPTK